jgi:hypothetical protein
VFVNAVPRIIFECEREEATGFWGHLNEELIF